MPIFPYLFVGLTIPLAAPPNLAGPEGPILRISSQFGQGPVLRTCNGGKESKSSDKRTLALGFSACRRYLHAAFNSDNGVVTREVTTGNVVARFQCDKLCGPYAIIPNNGNLLAGSAYEGGISIWDLNEGKLLHKFDGKMYAACSLDISRDQKHLVVRNWDQSIQSRRLQPGSSPITISQPHQTRFLQHVKLAPAADMLATSEDGGDVFCLDLTTLRKNHLPTIYHHPVRCLCFSPCGTVLAVGDARGFVTIWDLRTAKMISTFQGDEQELQAMSYSPDGRFLFTVGHDTLVHCWETLTYTERIRLHGHTAPISAIACSPDNNTIATGDEHENVLVWKLFRDFASYQTNQRAFGDFVRDLHNPDSAIAFQAMSKINHWRRQFLEYCSRNLKPIPAADGAAIDRMIIDLGSTGHAKRAQAMQWLSRIADIAECDITKAILQPINLEQKKRLELVLSRKVDVLNGNLAVLRAIELLEHFADRESVKILRNLANGDHRSMVTSCAERSLQRILEFE
jgi:hypothetical protein